MGIPQTTCYHARLCGNAKRLPVGTEAKVVFGDLRGHEAVTANKNKIPVDFSWIWPNYSLQFTNSPAHQLYYSSPPSRSHCSLCFSDWVPPTCMEFSKKAIITRTKVWPLLRRLWLLFSLKFSSIRKPVRDASPVQAKAEVEASKYLPYFASRV